MKGNINGNSLLKSTPFISKAPRRIQGHELMIKAEVDFGDSIFKVKTESDISDYFDTLVAGQF